MGSNCMVFHNFSFWMQYIYIYIYKIFQQSHYRLHIVMSTSKCYQGSIYFVNILTVGQKGERNVLQIHHLTTPTLQFFFF